jgi:hypothetical protein
MKNTYRRSLLIAAIVTAALIAFHPSSFGQSATNAPAATNQPPPLPAAYASASPYKRAAMDLWDIAKDQIPNTNDFATLSIGYGQNTGNGEKIEAGMLSFTDTTGTGFSLIGGRIGSKWKYGGGNFAIGRQDSWPVIGKVSESIGDGVIYDFQTHDPQNYSFVRMSKDFQIGQGDIGVGGMIANRSGYASADWIIGIHGGIGLSALADLFSK